MHQIGKSSNGNLIIEFTQDEWEKVVNILDDYKPDTPSPASIMLREETYKLEKQPKLLMALRVVIRNLWKTDTTVDQFLEELKTDKYLDFYGLGASGIEKLRSHFNNFSQPRT